MSHPKKPNEVPKEIPNYNNTGKKDPLKDPMSPNTNNPINPKTDEPTGKNKR